MRLFFALWPDADTRERIGRMAARLQLGARARRVPPESYHATLAFIGEVPTSRLSALRELGAAQRATRSTIRFDGCEIWAGAQVCVLAARRAPPEIIELSARLREASPVAEHQIGEPMPLRMHVTLARKVTQASAEQAQSVIAEAGDALQRELPLLEWAATSFSLIRSDTRGPHSVYTVVDTWPLLYETASE